jgi:hypothetical protein
VVSTPEQLAAAGTPDAQPPHLADLIQRDPLDVGRAARIVRGQLWRALITRDRTCTVKGCHRPPAQCHAHHVKHWADGGPTDLTNLVLLCHQHHHDHHDRGMTLTHQDGRKLTPRMGARTALSGTGYSTGSRTKTGISRSVLFWYSAYSG